MKLTIRTPLMSGAFWLYGAGHRRTPIDTWDPFPDLLHAAPTVAQPTAREQRKHLRQMISPRIFRMPAIDRARKDGDRGSR